MVPTSDQSTGTVQNAGAVAPTHRRTGSELARQATVEGGVSSVHPFCIKQTFRLRVKLQVHERRPCVGRQACRQTACNQDTFSRRITYKRSRCADLHHRSSKTMQLESHLLPCITRPMSCRFQRRRLACKRTAEKT